MKSIWFKYRKAVWKNCLLADDAEAHTVKYWQNRLFANTMMVIIPLSLLTTVPGVIFSLRVGLPAVALMDLLSFALVLYLAFGKGLSLNGRKFLLIIVTYIVASYTLFYIGFKGPGFLFLYSACIFGILILPVKYAYLWSWINVAICGLFTLVVHYDLSPVAQLNDIGAVEWMVISVNLLFLSFLTSALLPQLFKGLSNSFALQKGLQRKLQSKQVNLEEALEDLHQKNESLEQFAYSASHDMQEPLRMVKGFLGQLQRKYSDKLDDKARQYIYFAEDGAVRMSQMINDLLEFSRVGRQSESLQDIGLEEIIEEVIELQKEQIEESGAIIQYNELPAIRTYRTPLLQVLQNLVSNALKYRKIDEKPLIEIRARDLGHEWEISISDNGIGIEEQHFEQIFNIFQRLHGKEHYSGTGIGLALVKKNVAYLGGRIWLESKPGEGSIFYFTLPKHKQ